MATSSRRAKSSTTSDADKYSAAIRDIQTSGGIENKKCFECQQRGPTYVDVTIGSFVCTKCSGVLRGITPPHRIKSISMSSFTAEEVESMRGRGNTYCAKVWLGLHDGKVIGNDAESIKDFIIQKYEKKRYYVDPSTIRHSIGSTASTASSISQNSDGCNLVPLTSSIASANGTSKGSEMIGTTIQLQLHSRKQNISSQLLPSSNNKNSPSAVSNTGLAGLSLSTSGLQHPATELRQKNSAANSNATVGNSTAQSSLNQAALSVYALPGPSKDPFVPNKLEKPSRPSNSGFPDVPLPKPTFNTSHRTSILNPPQNIPNKQSSSESASHTFKTDFANFDMANFEDTNDFTATEDLSKLTFPSSGQTKLPNEPQGTKHNKTAQDRYAALKDLDDMFKTTVMSEGSSNASSATTGAAIFGPSPIPSHPTMHSALGPVPDRTIRTPSPVNNKLQENQMIDEQFKKPQPNNSDWTALWPQEQNISVNATSINIATASDNNFTSSLATSNKSISNAFSSGSSNLPINPFTGPSNLAQLNTSPWPTTGSSPVQSTSQVWPPNLTSNLKSKDDALSSQQKQAENRFEGIPSSNANSNFADFGNINTFSNSHQPKSKSTLGTFPDPFGEAPNSNLHQQSDNNNDLFANAPKPPFDQKNDIDKTIGILTSDIFGLRNSSQNNSKNAKEPGQYDFGIDPWASSNLPKETVKTTSSNFGWPTNSDGDSLKQSNGTNNLFASSIPTASKSTNPFL